MDQQPKPLDGRVALVTGAGRGIGASIARRLGLLGASVVACGRTLEPLETLAKQMDAQGTSCVPFRADVSDLASLESLADTIRDRFGRLDILVNNAGVGTIKTPLHLLPLQEWDRVIDINLKGVYYCVRTFYPLLRAAGGGHIVNISSLAGKNPLPNGAVYAASKWGLNGLSYSLAEELRAENIRVSVICPGSVDTELSPHEGKDKRKMLLPDDIAHAVATVVTQAPQSFISEILIRPTQKP